MCREISGSPNNTGESVEVIKRAFLNREVSRRLKETISNTWNTNLKMHVIKKSDRNVSFELAGKGLWNVEQSFHPFHVLVFKMHVTV